VGAEIQRESFTKADFDAFDERLRAGLVALEQVLARPGFSEGERTIGAEPRSRPKGCRARWRSPR
jgi:hypothetical protein